MYKVIIFPGLFYAIKILVFQVVRGGERVKHSPKSKKKKSVCCTLYLRNHTSYDYHLSYTIVN